jgi:hypothetical protein
MARKIRDRRDALACLEAMDESAMGLTPWAHAHGVDARSLNCWRLNLGWASGSGRVVELVPDLATAFRRTARYTVRVDGVEIDVDDHFREETLVRLLEVVAGC